MAVLRPCPLTTMRANFAVCDPVAGVESIAESMCPGCVQILLGRWHVIKDRQHLWLHERGACGCTIPGSAIPTAVGPMGHGMPAPQYTTVGTFASQQGYAQASTYGQQPQHDYAQVPTYEQRPRHGYARVPTYEQRVAENPTPELFAVSWAREHRLRHDAGLCNCHIDFTPVAQTIFQEDVRDSLRSIRRRENRIMERYGRGSCRCRMLSAPLRSCRSASIAPCGLASGRQLWDPLFRSTAMRAETTLPRSTSALPDVIMVARRATGPRALPDLMFALHRNRGRCATRLRPRCRRKVRTST